VGGGHSIKAGINCPPLYGPIALWSHYSAVVTGHCGQSAIGQRVTDDFWSQYLCDVDVISQCRVELSNK